MSKASKKVETRPIGNPLDLFFNGKNKVREGVIIQSIAEWDLGSTFWADVPPMPNAVRGGVVIFVPDIGASCLSRRRQSYLDNNE